MTQKHQIRSEFIDYLKGVLIVLVVLGHCIQFVGYDYNPNWNENGYWRNPVFKMIYMFHMPLFMGISGYLSYSMIERNGVGGVLFKRGMQLLLPVFCWALVHCAVWNVFLLYMGAVGGEVSLKVVTWGILREFCTGYWFLWAVFGSSVVVSGLRKLSFARPVGLALASAAVFLLPDAGNLFLFKYVFPFFCLGYVMAGPEFQNLKRANTSAGLAVGIGLSAVCYLLWDVESYVYVSHTSIGMAGVPRLILRYISGFILSWTFSCLLFRLFSRYKSSWLAKVGRISLGVYVLQALLLSPLDGFPHPLKESQWFTFLIAPVMAVAICYVCERLCRLINVVPIAGMLFLGQRVDKNMRSA